METRRVRNAPVRRFHVVFSTFTVLSQWIIRGQEIALGDSLSLVLYPHQFFFNANSTGTTFYRVACPATLPGSPQLGARSRKSGLFGNIVGPKGLLGLFDILLGKWRSSLGLARSKHNRRRNSLLTGRRGRRAGISPFTFLSDFLSVRLSHNFLPLSPSAPLFVPPRL